jgi:hypothetical protein
LLRSELNEETILEGMCKKFSTISTPKSFKNRNIAASPSKQNQYAALFIPVDKRENDDSLNDQ